MAKRAPAVTRKRMRSVSRKAGRGSVGYEPGQRLAAAEFKTHCLELMDRVRETRAEYVVTKHGKPVAKLVPYEEPKRPSFFGCMKGTVLKYERPYDGVEGEWFSDPDGLLKS